MTIRRPDQPAGGPDTDAAVPHPRGAPEAAPAPDVAPAPLPDPVPDSVPAAVPDPSDPTDPGAPASDIVSARGLASPTRWMVAGRVVTQASRLVVSVILANLLGPEAFGIVAVAMTTIVLLEIFKNLGTGAAVIQRAQVDRVMLDSVFYLNIATGLLAAGLMVAAAPGIAVFFGSADATNVVRAMAIVLAVGGVTQVHHALLRRTMRFDAVAAVEMVGALTTGVLSIALALAGAGVWSMVWGNLAGAVAGSVVAWVRSGWTPSRRFSVAPLREIAGFSLHTAGANLMTFALQNTDKILVGRWLGTTPLGVYTLAQRTVSYPLESISGVLMQVLFPAFARAQDDNETLRKGYTRAAGAIAFVTLPVMVGAAVVADPLVRALLGPEWRDLIPLLWFMAPAGALAALLSAVNTLYSAKGRADWMFRWGVFSGVLTLGAFALGLQWGLLGLSVAYLVVMIVQLPLGYGISLRLIDMRLRDMARALAPYFVMTLVMAAGAAATVQLMEQAGATPLAQLLTAIGVGALVYGGLALWRRPAALRDVLTLATSRG